MCMLSVRVSVYITSVLFVYGRVCAYDIKLML